MAGIIGLGVHDTRASAQQIATDVRNGNTSQLKSSLQGLRSNVQALRDYSMSPAWVAGRFMPVLGNQVGSATAILQSADRVATASADFDVILDQIGTQGQSGQLISAQVLAGLTPAAQQLSTALADLSTALQAVDLNGLPSAISAPLANALESAQQLVPRLQQLLTALPAITDLLGAAQTKRWFVALQNEGESRGTGGLVGSYAIVDLVDGKATPIQVGANEELTAKGNSSSIPPDSQQLWGPRRLEQIYGVNLSPNYPFAGELLSTLWQAQSGAAPDAVLAIDQRVTALLIGAVNGVVVDGVLITEQNAISWLTDKVYRKYPDAKQKDEFINQLILQLMQKISSGQFSAPRLATQLVTAVLEDRVLLWSNNPTQQELLASSPLGGQLSDAPGPFAMAVVNNNGGNKMDTFLYTSVAYRNGECVLGGRRAQVSVELFNNPPADIPSYVAGDTEATRRQFPNQRFDGFNQVRVAVYLPTGAYISKIEPGQLYSGSERNHPVSMFGVELNPGERKTITVDFTIFGTAETVNAVPDVTAQPMLNPQTITIEQGTNC